MKCVVGYILFVLFASFLGLGCIKAPPFVCHEDAQCNSKPPGICVALEGQTGYCALPTDSSQCNSGFIYHESAIPELAEKCAVLPRFDLTSSASEVEEKQPFTVHVIAYGLDGRKIETYTGKPNISSKWHDFAVREQHDFVSGETDIVVEFNRETTAETGPAVIDIKDGAAQGHLPIKILAPKWTYQYTVQVVHPEFKGTANRAQLFLDEKRGIYNLLLQISDNGIFWTQDYSLNKLQIKPTDEAIVLDLKRANINIESSFQDGENFFIIYVQKENKNIWGFATSKDGYFWTTVSEPPVFLSAPENQICVQMTSEVNYRSVIVDGPKNYRLYYTSNIAGPDVALDKRYGICATMTDGKVLSTPSIVNSFTYVSGSHKEGTIYKAWDFSGRYLTSNDGLNWKSKTIAAPLFAEGLYNVIWDSGIKQYVGLSIKESGKEMEVYTRP